MAKASLPTPDRLSQLLRYDAETGKLYWRERTPADFPEGKKHSPSVAAGMFNRRYAGREAFTASLRFGHKQGSVDRHHLVAHRVAWAIYFGEWPNGQIDHLDHNPSNNRIANLRCVNHAENMRNRSFHRNNTSGYCGVSYDKVRKRWKAGIRFNGKYISIGRFDSAEEAGKAVELKRLTLDFHENHGRVA